MAEQVTLIHRETGEHVKAVQYIQGMHPPPEGVKVMQGHKGVIARATTADGDNCQLINGDWLVETHLGRSICTDTFVRAEYYREGEEPIAPVKPEKLG